MDDREFPPNDLQIDSKDSLSADYKVESLASNLVSSADENENQLDNDGNEVLTSSSIAMGRQDKGEQDSINNNENMDGGDCTPSCKESETERRSVNVHMDPQLEEKPIAEKQPGGKRSPRSKRNSSKKSKGVPTVGTTVIKEENTLITDTVSVHAEGAVEANENFHQKEQKQTLQSLFSLLREEVEQMDSKILPLCLHQIAETYFQEEEYEKAMKFIQLERLYHEQLLANLSSIQEQWERKWKTAVPSAVTTLRNSAKELSGEELEKLTRVCSSHQQPQASKNKLVAAESTWEGGCLHQFMESKNLNEREAAAFKSGTETCPGIGPKKEDKQLSTSSPGENKTERQTEAGSLWVAAGKDHMEEQHCSAESTLEPHTQSTGTVGRPSSGCLLSGDAGKDNSLQLRERQLSKDAGEIEGTAGELGVKLPFEPMVDALVLTDADYMPTDFVPTDKDVQADRNLLRSKHTAGSSEIASGQLGNSDLKQQQKQPDDERSSRDRTASNVCCECNKVSEHESTAHSRVCKEIQRTAGQEDKVNNEEQEDLFLRFLNGNIIDTEESFANLANQEDFDAVPDISPERPSYNSLEALSLDDSFSSLDELARRIEIAEIAPAEGLVSILKKRDDREGKTIAQVQQRQTKRRVRFQEMEDTLDQDEVAGGSCILLILLCIATVFLSIGGTALYCTFGDMESPVCTDFAANMDFYYTQILRRMEELKHWIAFS
ncbi:consortin [Aquila chrysaetos chrysaetos]|uniref:Consortin, connexin sorting protein n=1 Tax=Aquila chrysaetos chrysaetos TaxID=223781 RepID=A0A663EJ29_AQUCH|nr:consortin [Aquila chrysaetos chrysaetos]XP_029891969.1 consortin [Aquila chrysaetos chrysaetos]XP_029891970.1 consortin [Aquila chrysaetos chrysaetos]XP_029891973.1 consortin [Aquila chrysaetos chrysaetos]XP_029891974.1 consortin [Aquila chrysaetos chrysaetos]XP_040984424.1 consortin [Aquila chrysaetos chrysaetos]XP_040984425.1 consortin [Aquila chrysaetos chrysaetos]XP_040984426.1 consortin [Aquila chrysaetos chrysaetos]XP_040984427.1 consortin [Aquila chrysaetos chrysaetos]XP_04098442